MGEYVHMWQAATPYINHKPDQGCVACPKRGVCVGERKCL